MAAVILTGRLPVLLALELSVLLPGLYLAGALLVAAAVVALIRRWRRDDEFKSPDASEQLAQFRTLYEEGALSEEEYRRLRTVLGGELRRAVDLPPRPAASESALTDAVQPAAGSGKNGDGMPPPSEKEHPA